MKKCSTLKIAAENKRCIYNSECTGFRDDILCLSKCRPHTFIFRSKDKKYCHSMVPVYIAIAVLSIIVILNVVFGMRILCLCYHIRQVSIIYPFQYSCW
jgi:hypothetical protein